MVAVLSSNQFRNYTPLSDRANVLDSDLITIANFGGYKDAREMEQPLSLRDLGGLGETVIGAFRNLKEQGDLHRACVVLRPPQSEVETMDLLKDPEDELPTLPLTFKVYQSPENSETYAFSVLNEGLKGPLKEGASKRMNQWYAGITKTLNDILPNPVAKSRD